MTELKTGAFTALKRISLILLVQLLQNQTDLLFDNNIDKNPFANLEIRESLMRPLIFLTHSSVLKNKFDENEFFLINASLYKLYLTLFRIRPMRFFLNNFFRTKGEGL